MFVPVIGLDPLPPMHLALQDHPDVKLLGFDHNKDVIVHYAATLLDPNSSNSSAQYVDGIAFHW